MFRLSRDGCTSLSMVSILTRPFTVAPAAPVLLQSNLTRKYDKW